MNVLYPGSFDPITKGHMNIIEQACQIFDVVVVAILINPDKKNTLFTPEERLSMIKELYLDNPKVKVISASQATVDIALAYNCQAIIRGLRGITDFDYEYQLAITNKEISQNQISTICFFAEPQYQNISSSMVKQILNLEKPIDKYVALGIKKKILAKGGKRNE